MFTLPENVISVNMLLVTDRDRPYHHGDLERALVSAATDLVVDQGVDGCSLRAVARSVGVSPSAAYRHFSDRAALLAAVARRAYADMGATMRAEVAAVPGGGDPRRSARRRVVAVGVAYVRWALAEPERFRAATGPLFDGSPQGLDDDPYLLLQAAVDELVAAGGVHPGRREGADLAVWTAAHGLAVLVLDGVVDLGPGADPLAVAERLVDGAVAGLATEP